VFQRKWKALRPEPLFTDANFILRRWPLHDCPLALLPQMQAAKIAGREHPVRDISGSIHGATVRVQLRLPFGKSATQFFASTISNREE